MRHVQDNAAEAVRRVLDRFAGAERRAAARFRQELDDGSAVVVSVAIDRAARRATVDFTGTSPQRGDNFNAPEAVTTAAVLYVFRTLVDADIPLNDGCLEPIDIVIPPGSMLSPARPAAVAAGNVETSQAVTAALLGALGAAAASQGTMNNLTFGDDRYQYYETHLRRRRGRPGLGRLQRRADPHDQLAPHRSGGAGVAISRCAWRSSGSAPAAAATARTGAATARSGGCGFWSR